MRPTTRAAAPLLLLLAACATGGQDADPVPPVGPYEVWVDTHVWVEAQGSKAALVPLPVPQESLQDALIQPLFDDAKAVADERRERALASGRVPVAGAALVHLDPSHPPAVETFERLRYTLLRAEHSRLHVQVGDDPPVAHLTRAAGIAKRVEPHIGRVRVTVWAAASTVEASVTASWSESSVGRGPGGMGASPAPMRRPLMVSLAAAES